MCAQKIPYICSNRCKKNKNGEISERLLQLTTTGRMANFLEQRFDI